MSQGKREVVAAHVFGAALRLAPTLDDKMLLAEQALEELEHFEIAAALYGELTDGSDLHTAIAGVADLPPASSWAEVAVAQFLLCSAEKFQLSEYRESSCGPYAEIVEKLMADEEGHASAGEANLRKLCGDGSESLASLQDHVDRWLRISLALFTRADPDREQQAVELGLRPRESTAAIRDYLIDLRAEMSRLGLKLGFDIKGAPETERAT